MTRLSAAPTHHQTSMLMTTPQEAAPVIQPTFGAAAPFAPRPQPSALSATPIFTQQIDAEEPEVIRYFRFVTIPSRSDLRAMFFFFFSQAMARTSGR